MNSISDKNKKAWEYRAYEFWNMNYGTPKDKATQMKKDPLSYLDYHKEFFSNIKGLKIANVCGSNGRKAVPLALLGSDVTIFDISDENKKYALELADNAGVKIDYVLGDFYDIPLDKYSDYFDIIYMEGGILHYFHDLDKFMSLVCSIVKPSGKLILSDFHPFRKISRDIEWTDGNYFDSNLYDGNVAYQSFFPDDEQKDFPRCLLRYYTLSEMINATIDSGFILDKFEEHPDYNDGKTPFAFTIYGTK